MTKREIAFLLIGLGAGLLLSVALTLELMAWYHHMFIIGFTWRPASIVFAVPFVLMIWGVVILYRNRSKT